ncbi:N-acetylmuramoyl-L-alanine amidase family protein [Orenia marismortui]|uniref:N-acetylmuramoyl-L-alanine amidase n=1 Tax=Orenia marismortui TaxID=46469 RepID=A0A4R8GWH8_9FIRM|nr:N-acetylmuramoyl-L-alanine amidase [Orenia marismortui]TDX46593.1 N-acetylmuramoyl-L-alanine amidase [Orenia marismortui]
MNIIIDPGHGGKDPGASGQFSNEKDIALKISRMLYALLKKVGHKVRLTREDDSYPKWEDRVISTTEDLFISIHCNACGNYEVEGIETLHYPGSEAGEKLASLIQKNLKYQTGRIDRKIKERKDLYVLKKTRCPAVLVETGFISNPKEEISLNNAEYQYILASAVAEGIKDYLEGEV